MNNGTKPTAIVTGASSGIGAATAVMLAKLGWNVTVNAARSIDRAGEVAKECEAAGAKVIIVGGDVSKDEDCRRIASETEKAFGGIDALVNNAGMTKFCPLTDLEGLSADDFLRMTSVNVVGAFQMSRACAPALRRSMTGRAAIVNVTSNAALTGLGSSIAYSASKGALSTLTLSLARALAPDIRVNAVAPGFTLTPWHTKGMSEQRIDAVADHYERTNPLKRNVTPDDVAETIVALIRSAPSTTGQTLLVDGGDHLHTNAAPPA